MRVLGIDPGSRFTGFGVVDQIGARLRHVGHGVIRLDGAAPLEQRLDALYRGLTVAMDTFRPDAVAVEGVFTFKNARSALILGHARGVALLVAAQRALPVHEYPPAKVKKAVGANGASDKNAVARMVRTFLTLPELERADASDALAVAICHLNHARAAAVPTTKRGAASAARPFASLADRLRPAYEAPRAAVASKLARTGSGK
ncbi:MAG: crossover junction endodeoxyribonuclease RuvC [Myxococcaceae bacterium]|nr:crossover junction endodeoxyribonuclease RuvC [Myxococcaceae bacterium]